MTSATNTRFIASALLERNGSYLFIRQAKEAGAYPDSLHIPGGGIEPGETPLDAIKREIWEEVGVQAQNLEPVDFAYDTLPYKGELTVLVFLRFAGNVPIDAVPVARSDAKEVVWLDRASVAAGPHNPATLSLLSALGLS